MDEQVPQKSDLQKAAETYLSACHRIDEAKKRRDRAASDMEVHQSTTKEIEKILLQNVGPNISLRIFRVNDVAIIVEYNKGVRCIGIDDGLA